MLPSDTPPLAKWPFLLGDIVLLGTAGLIARSAIASGSALPVGWIVACVGLAAIVGAVPFLADYARKQDEALDDRQRSLEALAGTVSNSAEQISIAANGLHALLGQSDSPTAAGSGNADLKKSLDQLGQRLEKAVSEIRQLLEKRPAESAPAPELDLQPLTKAVAELGRLGDTLKRQLEAGVPTAAAPEPKAAKAPATKEPEPAAEAPSPPPKAAPRKRTPPPEAPKPTPAAPPKAAPPPEPVGEKEPEAEEPPEPSDEPVPPAESSRSSDGATRVLVTAYIGIGNRLFIRGDGPGLAREKGVPLKFVSIGKWSWETSDATAPIKYRLFKNDSAESILGEQEVQPGQQQEVTATF